VIFLNFFTLTGLIGVTLADRPPRALRFGVAEYSQNIIQDVEMGHDVHGAGIGSSQVISGAVECTGSGISGIADTRFIW
jgi:hypothetical protein